MNIKKAKLEMFMMAEQVWKDAERWQQGIQHGQVAMKMVKTLNLRLFVTENRLNHAASRRELQNTEKQINNLYMRLQRPLTTMNKVLQTLTELRDNTARMLNRLTLWMDDDIVAEHMIMPTLKASKLLEVMQFLSQRYDAEWEVKEVVVNDLEHISNSYELDLLMDGWSICRHAGGQEFAMRLREYYEIVGHNQPLVMST
ncbi:uncharacterized protein LOC108142450 [Drosophila elegans]|uniref:uncharacterized protein LOC108142450 n=1 Tax=Drosophila elegans TaxID=30023 RepID=UPI0007E62198|nr:uncharacterized protein LOC108142450 [Drosophila elegans]